MIKTRMSWSAQEILNFRNLWEIFQSLVIIAIVLSRTLSSVRVQASRLGFPRRVHQEGKRISKWTKEELQLLQDELHKFKDKQGRILIVELANHLNRGVDAVFYKIAPLYSTEDEALKNLNISGAVKEAFKAVCRKSADDRNAPKMRDCLTCQTPFWSEGAGNRMCNKCKRSDLASDW